MHRRRFLHAIGIAAGLGVALPLRAEILRLNDAINQSGRQRMLSQRIAKTYLQMGQGIDTERSARIFSDSMTLFDRQLGALQAFAPTAENRTTLADMKKGWGRYRDLLLSGKPNRDDAKNVLSLSDELLGLAHAATLQLEAASGTAGGHLVNIAGRQRMLSQRMAKLYQAANWGVAPANGREQLVQARNEFLAAMKELFAAVREQPAIAAELDLAQQQWFFFDQALRSPVNAENRMRFAINVATTSERILETMDRVTGMMERLG